MKKIILDVCCVGRTFWFDKNHPNAIYIDKYPRPKGIVKERPNWSCEPDKVMDFTKLKFKNNSFKMVVFDPPHLKTLGKNSYMAKKYGRLEDGWEEMLSKGFDECWRVLDNYGTLIFKWNESEVTVTEILKLFKKKPLLGHPSGKNGKTRWMVFMKIEKKVMSTKSS